MEVQAKLRHLRIAPRKVRLVVNVIRGLKVTEAETQLRFMNKRAATAILKLVQSAAANAEHNSHQAKADLYIKSIRVDQGVTLKRWQPRAQGRATPIMKRASHITVVLDTKPKRTSKVK